MRWMLPTDLLSTLACGVLLGIPCMDAGAAATRGFEQTLDLAWKQSKNVNFVAPTDVEVERARVLFSRLLKGDSAEKVKQEFDALGLEVIAERIGDRFWTIIREKPGHESGKGLFAVQDSGRHMVQAPHVPSDSLTGEILASLADDGLPRAVAWNTVHRDKGDLAHAAKSYLLAFSLAFSDAHHQELVVQLHGFDPGKRKSRAAEESDAIVSSGTRLSHPTADNMTNCMRRYLAKRTMLYGRDVFELGATTNTIGQALRSNGSNQFVHIELGNGLRRKMAATASDRSALFRCFSQERQ